jgi:hypothetical protein
MNNALRMAAAQEFRCEHAASADRVPLIIGSQNSRVVIDPGWAPNEMNYF